MREIRTSGSPSGDWKRGLCATAPVVDSTQGGRNIWGEIFGVGVNNFLFFTLPPMFGSILVGMLFAFPRKRAGAVAA